MKTKILITSAAALLAGTMFASAQGMQGQGTSGAASDSKPPASAQSGKSDQDKAQKGQQRSETRGQGGAQQKDMKDEKSQKDGKSQAQTRGQGSAQSQKDQTSQKDQKDQKDQKSQAQTRGQGGQKEDLKEQKSQSQGSKPQTQGQGMGQQGQGQSQPNRDRDSTSTQQRQGQGQVKEGQENRSDTSVSLSTEERTKIREVVVKERSAPRVEKDKINFSLNVGTAVPRTVHIVEVPQEIIRIHPAWRGFKYFLVGDEIVIVEPDTLKIVAIIPA